eukprot:TRINITY_DN11365_c0_g1_i3.p1 TRINITY_DN11365_c0_g1~~TRINITY_DN11365_c0_g1_i3.p1  ORF type:complete len:615 (+),score=190.98 TRINITY_DN11365_c0_g1_i3:75-1919(+)
MATARARSRSSGKRVGGGGTPKKSRLASPPASGIPEDLDFSADLFDLTPNFQANAEFGQHEFLLDFPSPAGELELDLDVLEEFLPPPRPAPPPPTSVARGARKRGLSEERRKDKSKKKKDKKDKKEKKQKKEKRKQHSEAAEDVVKAATSGAVAAAGRVLEEPGLATLMDVLFPENQADADSLWKETAAIQMPQPTDDMPAWEVAYADLVRVLHSAAKVDATTYRRALTRVTVAFMSFAEMDDVDNFVRTLQANTLTKMQQRKAEIEAERLRQQAEEAAQLRAIEDARKKAEAEAAVARAALRDKEVEETAEARRAFEERTAELTKEREKQEAEAAAVVRANRPPKDVNIDAVLELCREMQTKRPVLREQTIHRPSLKYFATTMLGLADRESHWTTGWMQLLIPEEKRHQVGVMLVAILLELAEQSPQRIPAVGDAVAMLTKGGRIKSKMLEEAWDSWAARRLRLEEHLKQPGKVWQVVAHWLTHWFPRPKNASWGWSRIGWSFAEWWKTQERFLKGLDDTRGRGILEGMLELMREKEDGRPVCQQTQSWTPDRLEKLRVKMRALCSGMTEAEVGDLLDRVGLATTTAQAATGGDQEAAATVVSDSEDSSSSSA